MQITGVWHQRGAALLRVTAGVVMLWAGLEKLIGTPGGFSVAGFFKFGTSGSLAWPFVSGEPAKDAVFNPLHSFWVDLAGNAAAVQAINVLVVTGELAIGIALILGLATRFAAICGALMMGLFFLATWDFAYGIVHHALQSMAVQLFNVAKQHSLGHATFVFLAAEAEEVGDLSNAELNAKNARCGS